MIVAVPTNDKKLVSDVFGRAAFFALYDTEKHELTYLDNSANASLPGGAGINASAMLLENNVSQIVTIDFGPKAKNVMKDKPVEIVYIEKQVSLEEVFANYKSPLS